MALIEGGRAMRTRRTLRLWLLTAALVCSALAAAPAARAANGQYEVATCKSDLINFSTDALTPKTTFGMRWRSACNSKGQGRRALVLSNVPKAGKVKYGSYSAVVMVAPSGTQFQSIEYGGFPHRANCRYAVDVWAQVVHDATSKRKISKFIARAHCPKPLAHEAETTKTTNIAGTNEIIARIACFWPGGCSARQSNFLEIDHLAVTIQDLQPPAVSIRPDTPLALGQWVNGKQPLNYDATDNVGILKVDANVSGGNAGSDGRDCPAVIPETSTYDTATPCPNGGGTIMVDTGRIAEGTQALSLTALDPGGNAGASAPVTVRVDRGSPARVDVSVQGGDVWRSSNGFTATWTNAVEQDRAPIVGVSYKLCAADGGTCITGDETREGISNLALAVPQPGEWRLSLWRRDAAGNQTDLAASTPVSLRYDPDPPQVAFEPTSASDPTLVTVDASDAVSGVASGSIEISQSGSNVWQALPTQLDHGHLVARVDDAALPAGSYILRASAVDHAQNEASTTLRTDGEPMALNLPLRIVTAVQAGIESRRTVVQLRRKHGKRVRIRHQVTSVAPSARVMPGAGVRVTGRLVNAAGQGIPGQTLNVTASSSTVAEHAIGTVQTGGDGGFSYATGGTSSQTLRFGFEGSAVMLPAQTTVAMTVPAATTMTVNRHRLRNGQTVTFAGALRTVPAPPGGKLLELQVRLPTRWETFRTIRTDAAGHWTARYHFTRTYGLQRYRFRARLPEEAGYPFALGGSPPLTVVVRGR
jgi:hypothetical protein